MPEINFSIFKSYDIRGVYPEEINQRITYIFGKAFGEFIKRKTKKKKITILIGRDNRLSSPFLFKSLSQGIREGRGNIIYLGIVTSPMFYFAVHYFKPDGGIMITASHLSKEYNGFKLIDENGDHIDFQSGFKELQANIKRIYFDNKMKPEEVGLGKVIKRNILKKYLKFNLENFDIENFAPLKIVIDTGNGPTGILIPEIFKKTKCQVFHLFSKLDGNFPNRSPNTDKNNLKQLQKEVLKKKAHLGGAFDGDGDRIVFFDEKGKFIDSNLIFALISQSLLRKNKKKKILYPVNCSNIIPETIKKSGGVPVIWKVGHSHIKRKMKKENILFAGEVSGHYYYKEHFFAETPFFVLFKVIEELSKTKKTLSQLLKPFKKYYYSGEINLKVKDKEKILEKIKNKYQKGKILTLDGIRIDFKNWWFNLRPSQTEPVLRLVVEAKTKELIQKKKKEIIDLISKI